MERLLEEVGQPTPEMWLPGAIQVINASSTPHDYCKRLTTHPVLGEGMVGNHLFLITNSGEFRLLGGYGIYPFDEDQVFTQFEDGVFADAVNTGRMKREDNISGYDVQVCPAIKAGVPNGALLTVLKPGKGGGKKFDVRGFQELSYYLALGIFVSSAGFSPAEASKRMPSGEKLTERQLQILIGIAAGKTNMAIAKELILSESAIKQETVKIFRSLGVENRRQAAQKAVAMGLVPEGLS
jgi:DNA-binding CsgD family transcriptional regulator